MADNNFSVQLDVPDGVINAPVYDPGPSPLNPVLDTLSSGINQFKQDMDERARLKRQAQIDKEKQDAKNAGNYAFDRLLHLGVEKGADNAEDPWLSLVKSERHRIQNTPESSAQPSATANNATPAVSDQIIEGAVASGAVSPQRVSEVVDTLTTHGTELQDINAGIAQGTLPKTAQASAVDRILLDVRSKFPDVDITVVLSLMDKAGIKSPAFYEVQQGYEAQKSADETRTKVRNEALELGHKLLGVGSTAMPEDQVIAAGMEEMQNQQRLDATLKRLEIETKNQALTKAQKELADEQAATEIQGSTMQSILNTLGPYASTLNELLVALPEAGANPAIEQRATEVFGHMQAQANLRIEEAVARVAASGIPNALTLSTQLRDSLTSYVKNVFLDPIENRDQSTAKVAKLLTDKLGLNSKLAFPFIAQMKGLGIDMQLTDTLLSVMDPETTKRLTKEISNLNNTDMFTIAGRDTALIQMTEIAAILKGDKTLGQLDITPAQAKDRFKVIDKAVSKISADVTAGDISLENEFLNGLSTIAVSAGQLSSATNTRTAVNAMISIASAEKGGSSLSALNTLLRQGADPERAKTVALGTRAATAKLMQNLVSRGTKQYGPYDVVYNEGTGKWSAVFNQQRWNASPQSKGPYTDSMDTKLGINRGRLPAPPLPNEARDYVAALNYGSNFLVETAKWDENAPKVSEKELRAWYNQGVVPKKVIDELAAQRPDKKDLSKDSDVLKALNELDKVFTDGGWDFQVPTRPGPGGVPIDARGNAVVVGTNGQRVTIEGVDTVRAKYGNKPVFKQVVTQARAHGIPEEVAIVLAGHEGKFNPKARADAGKGRTAWGPMQVVDKFHDATAVERYGKKVKDLSPAQNVDLGLWILAQNYKQTGNWTDAMAMYHSGVSLAEATKQGRNDGNIATSSYINGLAAAAGLI